MIECLQTNSMATIGLNQRSCDIIKIYQIWYLSGKNCDVVMHCENLELKCHRLILELSSTYFLKIFNDSIISSHLPNSGSTIVLIVMNVKYCLLKKIIDAMYFGCNLDDRDAELAQVAIDFGFINNFQDINSSYENCSLAIANPDYTRSLLHPSHSSSKSTLILNPSSSLSHQNFYLENKNGQHGLIAPNDCKLPYIYPPFNELVFIKVIAESIQSASDFRVSLICVKNQEFEEKIQKEQAYLIKHNLTKFDQIRKDMIVAIKSLSDNKWYRAKIIQVLKHEKFEIEYLDLGYRCICNINDLMPLSANLTGHPIQSFHCFIRGLKRDVDSSWSTFIFKTFCFQVAIDLKAIFYSSSDTDFFPIDMFTFMNKTKVSLLSYLEKDNYSNETLYKNDLDKKSLSTIVENDNDETHDTEALHLNQLNNQDDILRAEFIEHYNLNVDANDSSENFDSYLHTSDILNKTNYEILGPDYLIKCLISFHKSPSKFWLHQFKDISNIESLNQQINSYYSIERKYHKLNLQISDYPGTFWVTQYSVDKRWYRVKVLNVFKNHNECWDIDTVKVAVLYIDYGNSEIVNLAELKPLLKKFSHSPPFALEAHLALVEPLSLKWCQHSRDLFEKYFGYQNETPIFVAVVPGFFSNDSDYNIPLDVFLWTHTDLKTGLLFNLLLVQKKLAYTFSTYWVREIFSYWKVCNITYLSEKLIAFTTGHEETAQCFKWSRPLISSFAFKTDSSLLSLRVLHNANFNFAQALKRAKKEQSKMT